MTNRRRREVEKEEEEVGRVLGEQNQDPRLGPTYQTSNTKTAINTSAIE